LEVEDPEREYIQTMAYRSRWFSELIFLEMNHIFYRWYERGSALSDISDDLREYLSGKYKEDISFMDTDDAEKKRLTEQYDYYYERIKKFGKLKGKEEYL
jgi:hypothetical protein